MKLKNIPNILSVIRILLVGVFVYTFFCVDAYLSMVVFLLAGATDVVDGYLARRNNWISELGKVLDPVADKLMQCTVLVCLYLESIIPIWFVIPFFAKELFTLIMGFIVLKRRSVVVVSRWYGKMTVCLFYATIVLSVMIEDKLRAAHPIVPILVFLPAVVCALITVCAYVKHYAGLKNQKANEKNSTEKADKADAAENI